MTTNIDDTRWVWEATEPTVSGSSGDISKLFRNEVVKNPGVFALDPPSAFATLMAREVIQNSADAADDLRRTLGDDAPDFEIDFHFESVAGQEKADLVRELDLASLAARADRPGDRSWRAKLGLSDHDSLAHVANDLRPLPTLQIVERGTTGMHGPFTGSKSKMYLALISLGYTAKATGSGGSYGYGKAGLIRGSAVRTVVAYTCFREQPDDVGVTRRLLGMTYWGQHELDGDSFTGFGRFGAEDGEGKVRPFENETADEIASRLGIETRDPADIHDLGTTFLLIDPTVDPVELVTAIERNWWPAIEDDLLTATVFANGERLIPRPKRDPVLHSFIESFELAQSPPDNQVPDRRKRAKLTAYELADGSKAELGTLGLVAEPGGWSYAIDESEDGEGIAHRSLVALVRDPRMIVEYLEAGMTRPYVRGTFVAHTDVNELLRQTEPKAHDSWQTRIDEGGIDQDAPGVAKAVNDRVKRNVGDFRKSLKPPPRPAEDIRLPELEKLFRELLHTKGSQPDPPPKGDRPFSILVKQHLVQDDSAPMAIRMEGTARFAVIDHPDVDDEMDVDITISYRYVEDGGRGQDAVLHVDAPAGFELTSDQPPTYSGTLGHSYVEFGFISEPYPADWTAKLKAEAEARQVVAAAEASGDE